ncbi:PH, RCC1 and FYVE domains-containing protein 1-like [Wolffia australiana]
MQIRSSVGGDGFRVSISSLPSNSSQGSGADEGDSLGDVYVWGQLWSNNGSSDALLPRLLDSDVVLDVQHIACGARHAAVVTRQGEVFSWGDNGGGRLGLGHDADCPRPQPVESLALSPVDSAACGESHTCVISASGDLYTWGDGRWAPKRVLSDELQGLQVLTVACGPWHTALVAGGGRLFTFGDGTFGALGHGDRRSAARPREVGALAGLRTLRVACGVWHTAAVVEATSRKLFTWGDGRQLGHGDKDPRLLPCCVSSLGDYSFQQVACGETMTVALTTSGHVFAMGSPRHGQLGNPHSDGSLPCVVQDRLVGETVEEIACGAHHVAVLTARSEVFTWGKGANGRLGHGDTEDRKTPTMVEALRDRCVKNLACGSDFTACVCIHKWVSSADQALCSGCRQAFGFTRKRHNCYNCGLVHCHSCTSKKALRAAHAPNPRKPHRVCDSCFVKLRAAEAAAEAKRHPIAQRRSVDLRERSTATMATNRETRVSKALIAPLVEPLRFFDAAKAAKQAAREESSPSSRAAPVQSLLQLKDMSIFGSISALQAALKPVATSPSPPASRSTSPYSTRPTSPRLGNPVFPKSAMDSLKNSNELLNQQVLALKAQVKTLKQRCDAQDAVIQRYERKALEGMSADEEESSRLTSLGIVKSLVTKRKDPLDEDVVGTETGMPTTTAEEHGLKIKESTSSRRPEYHHGLRNISHEGTRNEETKKYDENSFSTPNINIGAFVGSSPGSPTESRSPSRSLSASPFSNQHYTTSRPDHSDTKEGNQRDNIDTDPGSAPKNDLGGGKEIVEQFEPGVYVTVIVLPDETKVFKRVRFSRRKFSEQQAEDWWKANQDRFFKHYARPSTRSNGALSSSKVATSGAEGDDPSQSAA